MDAAFPAYLSSRGCNTPLDFYCKLMGNDLVMCIDCLHIYTLQHILRRFGVQTAFSTSWGDRVKTKGRGKHFRMNKSHYLVSLTVQLCRRLNNVWSQNTDYTCYSLKEWKECLVQYVLCLFGMLLHVCYFWYAAMERVMCGRRGAHWHPSTTYLKRDQGTSTNNITTARTHSLQNRSPQYAALNNTLTITAAVYNYRHGSGSVSNLRDMSKWENFLSNSTFI